MPPLPCKKKETAEAAKQNEHYQYTTYFFIHAHWNIGR